MKICKQCGKPRNENAFPYAACEVCFECHRENAESWDSLSWNQKPKQKRSEKQVAALTKLHQEGASAPPDSTKATQDDL